MAFISKGLDAAMMGAIFAKCRLLSATSNWILKSAHDDGDLFHVYKPMAQGCLYSAARDGIRWRHATAILAAPGKTILVRRECLVKKCYKNCLRLQISSLDRSHSACIEGGRGSLEALCSILY